MNITVKEQETQRPSIILELSEAETDVVIASIGAGATGEEGKAAVLALIIEIATGKMEDINRQVAECEKNCPENHSEKLLVLKLLQAKRIIKNSRQTKRS